MGNINESKWIDYSHGMELHVDKEPNSRQNENGILFLVEYYMLKDLNGQLTTEDIATFETITKALQSYNMNGDQLLGIYDRGAGESLTKSKEDLRTISHDNLTAIASFSYKHNLKFHKDIYKHGSTHFWIFDNVPESNRLKRIMHPRDIVYWSRLNKKCWGYLLLWYLCLEQIYSCYKKYKVRPTLWYSIKTLFTTGKWPERRKILHTDGKLLTFVRVNSLSKDSWTMRMCGRICGWILKKRFDEDYFHEIFKIYFRDSNHPNRVLSKNLQDEWRQ